ncbi:unnamed protein product [Sympodiomycopsis kandeliae]
MSHLQASVRNHHSQQSPRPSFSDAQLQQARHRQHPDQPHLPIDHSHNQTHPHSPSSHYDNMQAAYPDSPSSGDAAAKKKKKKGKGKRVEDDYEADTPHSPSANHNHSHATYQQGTNANATINGTNVPNQTPQGTYAATAQAQADLLATASDLYRRIEADPQGIPDDDAYWTSLPAHLRTFIRNALPLGQFPATANNDPNARHASTQAMIAVAQQLAQAAHASQRHLQQYPMGTQPYPSLPFDPAIFADLALHSDQSMSLHSHANGNGVNPAQPTAYGHVHFSAGPNPPPTQPPGEPLPPPIMMLNEYADETGDYDDDYYSDEELDGPNGTTLHDPHHRGVGDVGHWTNDGMRPMPQPTVNGNAMAPAHAPSAAKKKNKKKKKKAGAVNVGDVNAAMSPPPPSATAPVSTGKNGLPLNSHPPDGQQNNNVATGGNSSPTRNAPHPPPSSRAAGKQPMTFNSNAKSTAPNGHSHPTAPKRAGSSVAGSHSHGNGAQSNGHGQSHQSSQPQQQQRIWSTSTAEERERIRDFWLSLRENERRGLVQVEKDAVLRKMKDQQKHTCTCAVCGRKRSAIESELEVLYNTYYEELQQYANHQQQYVKSGGAIPPPPGPGPFPGSIALDGSGNVVGGNALTKAPSTTPAQKQRVTAPPKKAPPMPEDDDDYDDELDDDEYDDEYDDEEEEEEEAVPADNAPRRRAARTNQPANAPGSDVFPLGSSLTVKGILTVADDLLKNDGQKFLEMMEQLADRRMQREEDAAAELDAISDDDAEDDDNDIDDIDEEAEQDALTDEQRMEEGRRMFQIFAARLFEQRVLSAYRERVAQERQLQLLRELEEEDLAEKEKEAKKQKENQKKKDKKRQVQQKKEEERIRKENEKAAEEAAQRDKVEKQRAAELKKQEELRIKKEAERKAKEDERLRREEEKRKRLEEERAREAEKERKRKEKEDKARLEREAREAKEAERKAKEEARRQKELKDKEEKERNRAAQEAAKREKEQAEKSAAQAKAKQQAEQQKAANAVATAAAPSSPAAVRGASRSSSNSKGRPQASVPPSPAQAAPVMYARPPPSAQGSANIPARPSASGQHTGAHHGATAKTSTSTATNHSGSTLPAPPQGLPPRPVSAKASGAHSSGHTAGSQSAGASGAAQQADTNFPAAIPTGPVSLPKAPHAAQNDPPLPNATASAQPSFMTSSTVNPAGTAAAASNATSQKGVSQQVPTSANNISPARPPHAPALQAHSSSQAGAFSRGYSSPAFANSIPGAFDDGRSPNGLPSGRSPIGGSATSVKHGDGFASSGGLESTTNALSSLNINPFQGDAFGFGRGPSPGGPSNGGSSHDGAASEGHSIHSSPSQANRSAIQRPGPIGPIGRPRHASEHLDDAGMSSQNNFLRAASPRLPEGILGSSALGGDDELLAPQPRRTSSTVAPIGGTALFGFANSPWGSSSFTSPTSSAATPAGSGFGSIGASGSNSGSTLPSGLGNIGGSSIGGSGVSGSGASSGIGQNADLWGPSRSSTSSSWDRARFAFEQPASGTSSASSQYQQLFSNQQQSQHPQHQSQQSQQPSPFHHHQQPSQYGHFGHQQQGSHPPSQYQQNPFGNQQYGGSAQSQGYGNYQQLQTGQQGHQHQYQQQGSGAHTPNFFAPGAGNSFSSHGHGHVGSANHGGRSIFDSGLLGSPAGRQSNDRGY